ncbi:MAG: sigma-70 family RNA polymerase sigma factor [Oscillospiraceae bacterium]
MYSVECSRDEIISQNVGLVHACAHKFNGRGIEYDDLFQAGCIGLIKATDAFDVNRGVQFSTYAVPVILGEIRRLFRDGGSVKVSRNLKELSLKVTRQREYLGRRLGREPTIMEISESLQAPVEQIVEAINVSIPPVSLTESEDDGGGQIDLPVDSPEEHISDFLSLKQVVDLLCENDKNLIILRYFKHQTQTKTANLLGMTQVQVSRREKKILTFLRKELLQ